MPLDQRRPEVFLPADPLTAGAPRPAVLPADPTALLGWADASTVTR